MKHLQLISLSLIVCTFMSSCIKEELPVPAREPGQGAEVQLCTGSTYHAQLWYDLGTNSVVASNDKEDWDLAFGWDQDAPYMRLNSARLMRGAVSNGTDMNNFTDTLSVAGQFHYDDPSGDLGGLTIDLQQAGEKVIALDMGYTHIGLPIGVYKFKMVAMDAQHVEFQFASIGSSTTMQLSVSRDPNTALSYASLHDQQQLTIEPPIGTYDLIFTTYSYRFDDPGLDYIVNGILLARSGVRAAQVDWAVFEEVQLSDTLAHPTSIAWDVIGYDWKTYDFDFSLYTVDPSKVFIVQAADGMFYKIHFTDFYNDQGVKGCPKFEVVMF